MLLLHYTPARKGDLSLLKGRGFFLHAPSIICFTTTRFYYSAMIYLYTKRWIDLKISVHFVLITHKHPKAAPPPNNFKIAISRKIVPLTYTENSRLFLKRSKEAICKGFGSKIKCLTAWRRTESLGWPKEFKNVNI